MGCYLAYLRGMKWQKFFDVGWWKPLRSREEHALFTVEIL